MTSDRKPSALPADPGVLRPVSIWGTGSYAPPRVMTNEDFERIVDTSHDWIFTRTGMVERRIAAEDQATSDLATEAARSAIADAGLTPADMDMILVATITPDLPFPNTGCLVQHKLGADRAFCMSLEAACSGFVFALETARQYIASGTIRHALVIGAEKMSSIVNWKDRTTCVLFGDGAGAVVLGPAREGRGLISSVLGSDGSLSDLLQLPGGGSRMPPTEETVRQGLHYLTMNGREVFKHAVTSMTRAAREVLKRHGLAVNDVRWVIPHQANIRIIQAIADRVHIPMDRFIINVEKYGNTSGASIGLALDEAARDGRLKQHDLVLFLVFGGGFTWGSMLLEWDKP